MSAEAAAARYLRVGAAGTSWDGFAAVDVDIDARTGAGVGPLWGAGFRLPFADDSVAGAYVDHVLEYLDLADGARLVQELRRVLVRGGRARIVTEDLGRILDQHASADAWVAGGWYENGYDWNQQRCRMLNRAFREAGRRWLYDATEIARVGAVMGLRDPRRCRPGESGDPRLGNHEAPSETDLIVELEKPRRPERAVGSGGGVGPGEANGDSAGAQPLVSVLVPLYRATYLRETVASVLEQTYENFELVICDDGPPGVAEAILRSFAAHRRFDRIRYFHNGTRLGEPHNYVACFKRAAGAYIKFLNDDDLLAPRCLEVLSAGLREHPSVTLATSHRELIDPDGQPLPETNFTERPVGRSSIIDGRTVIARVLGQQLNFIGEPSTVMFRKADAEAVAPNLWSLGGINFAGNGDVTLWTNLLAQGDLLYVTDSLSRFRRHPQQSSQNRSVVHLAKIAWQRIADGAAELGLYRPGEVLSLDARPLETIPWWPAPLRRRIEQARQRGRDGRAGGGQGPGEVLAEVGALLREAGGAATRDAELMVRLAELRFEAGDLRGALDMAVTTTRTTPHHQPAHLLVARLLQAAGDAGGAQNILRETQAIFPLIRSERGLIQIEGGVLCLAPEACFRVEADLPDAVFTIRLLASTTAGFRNLPIRIAASVAGAGEPATVLRAELTRDDETTSIAIPLPHRTTPTAITVGWRGSPERHLPAAVAPLSIRVAALELSLASRSAIR